MSLDIYGSEADEDEDLLVIAAHGVISERSYKGREEYGRPSLLDRNLSALELVDDAIEEAADQLVYLLALRIKLGGDP